MPMNLVHRKLCSSKKWAELVAAEMPGQLEGFDLGDSVLEIGPGFGATTRALISQVPALTALEIDEASVSLLRAEFDGRAAIVLGSGADMPFEDNTFSAVVCFTMLHHVPTNALQDAIFSEAHRVLRPGGLLRGIDSQSSLPFRLLHLGDTMNVLDHKTLPARLAKAGFSEIDVQHEPKRAVRFSALRAF